MIKFIKLKFKNLGQCQDNLEMSCLTKLIIFLFFVWKLINCLKIKNYKIKT